MGFLSLSFNAVTYNYGKKWSKMEQYQKTSLLTEVIKGVVIFSKYFQKKKFVPSNLKKTS